MNLACVVHVYSAVAAKVEEGFRRLDNTGSLGAAILPTHPSWVDSNVLRARA